MAEAPAVDAAAVAAAEVDEGSRGRGTPRPRVLFVCTHNRARSQLAEALLRHRAGDRLEVGSAGSEPAEAVHPLALRWIERAGGDPTAHRPKALSRILAAPFPESSGGASGAPAFEAHTITDPAWDLVVTVCDDALEACPVLPAGTAHAHWPTRDPSRVAGSEEERIAAFEEAAASLGARIDRWLAEEMSVLGEAPTIRDARPADFPAVADLLKRSRLPLAGVPTSLEGFAVAERRGAVVGCAGLERYGTAALLRSVAVAPEWRGVGLGERLVAERLEAARIAGIPRVALLTETAARFFPRFGFVEVARGELPAELGSSEELRGACPASAQAFLLKLS